MDSNWDAAWAMLPFAIIGAVFMGIASKAQEIKSTPLRGAVMYPSFAVGFLCFAYCAIVILFNMFGWIPIVLWQGLG